ncbi:hypothetical protein KA977_15755, partial [Candidatus Dependentiae bacterium]|nr:hypothetical protein [Candidatus Dependentiae bacterium]
FFYGSSIDGDYWRIFWRKLTGFEGYNAYLSVTAVFLIFISFFKEKNQTKKFFMFLMPFALIISLGKYTPIYKFFHFYVPGFNKFRWPVRFMYIYMFSAAVLAGIGISTLKDIINEGKTTQYAKIKKIIIITAIISIAITACLYLFNNQITDFFKIKIKQKIVDKGGINYNSPEFYYNASYKIFNTVKTSFLKFSLTTVLISLFTIFFKKFGKNAVCIPLAFLCAAELSSVHLKFLKTTDNNFCAISESVHSEFENDYRIFSDSDWYPPGINVLFNKMSINGYEPFILKKYNDYASKIEQSKNVPENLVFIKPDLNSKLFDLLSVKYVITQNTIENNKKFKLFKELKNYDGLKIYINTDAAPLMYISENIIYEKSEKNILDLMNKSDYDFRKFVFTSENTDFIYDTKTKLNCKIIKKNIKDDYAEFYVKTNKPSVLTFNYIYFPRWKVKINGIQKKLYNSNYLFMSVILNSSGEHKVEFYYE